MKFTIPVILLKELVIFPNQEIKIELNNDISKKVIKEANIKYNNEILVVAPIDTKEEEPSVDDLPNVGVIAKIKNKIALDNDIYRVTLRGVNRVAVTNYYNKDQDTSILYSEIMHIDLPKYAKVEENAIRRKLIIKLEEYINSSDNISNSILNIVSETKDLNKLTDIITSFLPFDVYKKLEYMQNINPLNRAIKLINDIEEEIRIIKIDDNLDDLVREEIDKSQKDFILKEKLKAIKKELGEKSIQEEDTINFRNLLNSLNVSKKIYEKINHEIDKFEVMNEASPEMSVLRNYLDWILNLPWNKKTKENTDIDKISTTLNNSHYGLDDVKTRILEYAAIKKHNPKVNSPIICLVGPPGVGKTSIALSIAEALNRKFYKISVGGLNDSTELVGVRRTYLAASPGKIIQGLKKENSKNPVILIDEVDKMVKDYKGDPASTLLEILDPVQNKYFVDNYIEESFDLSEVLFILTANNVSDIPLTLIDRVEVIDVNSYSVFEKKDIAKKYIIPRIFEEYKLDKNFYNFSDDLLYFIINYYTSEGGVRELERVLKSLIRKMFINNIRSLNNEKVVRLLGNPKYDLDSTNFNVSLGVTNALAVTTSGGKVMQVEVTRFKGTGKIIITGSVGKVMEESINVSLSYVKSYHNHLLNNNDIHIHFMETSIKKDGPSAGVSIVSAILSLLEHKEINKDIAFTGEVSLNGNILKVGGLKEKIIGAYNRRIKTIYIPLSNVVELKEIPDYILKSMEIIPVSNYKEIYEKLF